MSSRTLRSNATNSLKSARIHTNNFGQSGMKSNFPPIFVSLSRLIGLVCMHYLHLVISMLSGLPADVTLTLSVRRSYSRERCRGVAVFRLHDSDLACWSTLRPEHQQTKRTQAEVDCAD